MTAVHRPVRRSVENIDRGRDAILTIYPGGALGIRLKRHRREWTISVAAVYRMAVQRELENERAERRKASGRKVRVARRGL
jgi:hypothetical protein